MSVNVPTWYGRQYADNVMLLLQQKGSKLRSTVTEGMYKGEQASPMEQEGPVEMLLVDTRFEPMPRVDSDADRRWLFPNSYDLPQMVDHFDKLKTLVDPQSKKVENATFAAGRRIDRTIIRGMLGDNRTGKNGDVITPFLSTNVVPVDEGSSGTNTGLTVAKLIKARELLMGHNLDLDTEQLYMGITSKEASSLLRESQVISLDYNERPVLTNGKITQFMGFTFIHSELFGEQLVGGDHVLPAWAKSGVHLGLWEDTRTDISQRKDIRGLPWQVYLWITMDAARTEEKKVVKVVCDF
jgi:hypothetical protein